MQNSEKKFELHEYRIDLNGITLTVGYSDSTVLSRLIFEKVKLKI